jgi:undecaprenyl-diphosphatase
MTLDTQLFYLLNNLAGQSPFFDRIIVFFASCLPYILVTLFLVLLFFSQYSKQEKWQIFLVVSISSLIARLGITELIRFFYHRPRPFLVLPVHQLLADTSWSFPSGHATFFFAMATAVFLYNRKVGIVFFAAVILITVSRVITGIHYPSDIVGGAIIGIAVAYTTFYYVVRRMTAKSDVLT